MMHFEMWRWFEGSEMYLEPGLNKYARPDDLLVKYIGFSISETIAAYLYL
jgi:hypothetical protein